MIHESWDDNYTYYQQLADLLGSIAHSHSKVDIDEKTLLRWRDLMGIMREIDTEADDSGAKHSEVLSKLENFEIFEDRYPHIAPNVIGQQTFDRLVSRTQKILKLGEFVSKATVSSRYIKLRTAEAINTAEVFRDGATEHVNSQDRFNNNFMPLLTTMAITSCFIDSAHDLKDDYAEGKSELQPLLSTRLVMATKALTMSNKIVPVVLHGDVFMQTIEAAKLQFQRKIPLDLSRRG